MSALRSVPALPVEETAPEWLLESIRATLGLAPDAPIPATVSVEEAGEICGISRGLAYESVRDGSIYSLRFGRAIRVPLAALILQVGGCHAQAPAGPLPRPGPRPGGVE